MSHLRVEPSSRMSRAVPSPNLGFTILLQSNHIVITNTPGFGFVVLIEFEDRQESAQWFASPSTLTIILETLVNRMSSLKGQALVIQSPTMYEGTLEKVGNGSFVFF